MRYPTTEILHASTRGLTSLSAADHATQRTSTRFRSGSPHARTPIPSDRPTWPTRCVLKLATFGSRARSGLATLAFSARKRGKKYNVIVSVLKSAGDGRASATFRRSRAHPGVSNPSFYPVQLSCLFRVAKPSSPRAQVLGEHVSEAEMPSKGESSKPRKKSRNALSGGTPPESRRARSPRRGARFLPAGRANIWRRS